MRAPYERRSVATLSRSQQLVRRAECLERIPRLLQQGHKTAAEIGQILEVHPSTAFAYLHFLAHELHTVRKSRDTKCGSALWELGADPALTAVTSKNTGAPQRSVVPAQQLGMWRDWLVAALFGPAPEGVTP